MAIHIRFGKKEDIPAAYELVEELAIFEKSAHELVNTLSQMVKDGSGISPSFEFIVAEDNKIIVGLALFFPYYSTWKGSTLYLEDLIVSEPYRKQGIGKKLLYAFLKYAGDQGYKNVLWQVLNWNVNAIEFYKKCGVLLDNGWINCRMSEDRIKEYLNLADKN